MKPNPPLRPLLLPRVLRLPNLPLQHRLRQRPLRGIIIRAPRINRTDAHIENVSATEASLNSSCRAKTPADASSPPSSASLDSVKSSPLTSSASSSPPSGHRSSAHLSPRDEKEVLNGLPGADAPPCHEPDFESLFSLSDASGRVGGRLFEGRGSRNHRPYTRSAHPSVLANGAGGLTTSERQSLNDARLRLLSRPS